MLTSASEHDRAEAVIASDALDPVPISSDEGAERRGEIDLRSLPAGTLCVIDTCNSQYHVKTLGRGLEVLVEGGPQFTQSATAPIVGSIVAGHRLRPGLITVGKPMEIVEGARRVVTSRVCAIRLAAALTEG
jgi:hypothetical protein